MTQDPRQSLSKLIANYRAVRAPSSLAHNAKVAARTPHAPRRWALPLAAAAALVVAATLVLRPDAPPEPDIVAHMPSLATLGGRLANIDTPPLELGSLRPPMRLPSLPKIPTTPALKPPPPTAPADDDAAQSHEDAPSTRELSAHRHSLPRVAFPLRIAPRRT